ncbi:hypothetical protein DYH10_01275 [Candidatus Saccharibacteria bacterium CPR2]|nr:hypothetical protein [Candidatus Saccharibacteria bacterium CPR2]
MAYHEQEPPELPEEDDQFDNLFRGVIDTAQNLNENKIVVDVEIDDEENDEPEDSQSTES